MSRYEFELRFDDSYWPSLCTMCSFTWWLFVQPRLSYMPLQSFASLLCLFSLLLIFFFFFAFIDPESWGIFSVCRPHSTTSSFLCSLTQTLLSSWLQSHAVVLTSLQSLWSRVICMAACQTMLILTKICSHFNHAP